MLWVTLLMPFPTPVDAVAGSGGSRYGSAMCPFALCVSCMRSGWVGLSGRGGGAGHPCGNAASPFIRQAELGPDKSFSITIVAHSLGAAATLVYLVHCGMGGKAHRVTKTVLMSPAGH